MIAGMLTRKDEGRLTAFFKDSKLVRFHETDPIMLRQYRTNRPHLSNKLSRRDITVLAAFRRCDQQLSVRLRLGGGGYAPGTNLLGVRPDS